MTTSLIRTLAPYENPADAQPIELWVQNAEEYRLPAHCQGLPVKIKEQNLEDFGRDESGGICAKIPAVWMPRTEKQIALILKQYASCRKPITIGAAHTGLCRGAVPSNPKEELLSMRHVLSIPMRGHDWAPFFIEQEKDGSPFVVSAPGVPLMELQKFVESHHWTYPVDTTERTSLIGGNAATNASGARTFKYGPTRAWVRALRIVLTSGEVLSIRRGQVQADEQGRFEIQPIHAPKTAVSIPAYTMPRVKNAAGYYTEPRMDLIDLFIGSEGTLGVISEVELALIPTSIHRYSATVYFPSDSDARAFAKEARALSLQTREKHTAPAQGLDASLLEYFDQAAVGIIRGKFGGINLSASAAIYFEQEISKPAGDSLENEPVVDTWRNLMLQHNALDIQEAFTQSQREKLREERHSVPEEVFLRIMAVGRQYPDFATGKIATDIAVPHEHFDTMMEYYPRVLKKTSIPYIIWGHIGNDHVHMNMIPQNPDQFKQAQRRLLDFAHKAKELNGTITAEHGVGKIKTAQLEIMLGEEALHQMAAVKLSFDPQGILNRGNIIPTPILEQARRQAVPSIAETPTSEYTDQA